MAIKKEKRGRPRIKNGADKVKVKHVYITDNQERAILRQHKTLSNALKIMALQD